MMRFIPIFIYVIFCVQIVYAQEEMITTLPDIEVQADNQKIEDGKMILYPSNSDKNLSTDPSTLLKRMHIPSITEKDGILVNTLGIPITYYINGVKAQSTDIATFWPRNVLKIEYIENPKDPIYEGAQAVVNFVIKEYESGGVSKVNLFQAIPNNGSYGIATKYTRNKLTCSASFLGGYSYDDKMSNVGTEIYNDIYLNRVHYDEIVREMHQNTILQTNSIEAHFNLKYVGSEFRAIHDVSYQRYVTPKLYNQCDDEWSTDLFPSNKSESISSSESYSIGANGYYYWKPSDRFSYSSRWDYVLTHNHENASSTIGGLPTVYNNSEETVHKANISITPSYYFSDKFYMQLNLRSRITSGQIKYISKSNLQESIFDNRTDADLYINYMPSYNVYVQIVPGIRIETTALKNNKIVNVYPLTQAYISWNTSSKFLLSFGARYYLYSPSVSERTDVLIQNSSLLWIKGNPGLKSSNTWRFDIYGNWITTNFLNISPSIGYDYGINENWYVYTSAPKDMGGLIKEYFNGPNFHIIRSYLGFDLSLLNSKLHLSATPCYNYYVYTGDRARQLGQFTYSLSADYRIKNCSFSISYESRSKSIALAGYKSYKSPSRIDFQFSYGNGPLYVSAKIENIMHTRRILDTEYISDNFINTYKDFMLGRRLMLTLTYTFGYGRMLRDDFDFMSPDYDSSIKIK